MKITVSVKEFLGALRECSLSTKKVSYGISQNVHIQGLSDGLALLTKTTTETSVVARIAAQVAVGGEVVAPAAEIQEFLRYSNAESLEIESTKSGVKLVAGSVTIMLLTSSPFEFPKPTLLMALHDGSNDNTKGSVEGSINEFPIEFSALSGVLTRTAVATDSNSSRFALGCIQLSTQHGKLIAVATDGRRLAYASCPCDGEMPETLLPCEHALHLCKHGFDGLVKLSSTNSQLQVVGENLTFITRLGNESGRFPNWRQSLPESASYHPVAFQSLDMIRVLQQVAVTTDRETCSVDIDLSFGSAKIKSSMFDKGSADAFHPVTYAGPDISLRLNHKYMVDAIRSVAVGEELFACVCSAIAPVVFSTCEDFSKADNFCVVMPMDITP